MIPTKFDQENLLFERNLEIYISQYLESDDDKLKEKILLDCLELIAALMLNNS